MCGRGQHLPPCLPPPPRVVLLFGPSLLSFFSLREPSPPLLGFPNLPVRLAWSFPRPHGDFHVSVELWPPWRRTFDVPLTAFLTAPAWLTAGAQASRHGGEHLHLGSDGPGF